MYIFHVCLFMRLSQNVFLRDRCMSRKQPAENVVAGSNGSEGAACASKIRLVESVIMNNASCAPVTLAESASRRYRYCIGEGGGSDCGSGRGKGYSRFIACSKFSSVGSNACPSRETIYGK